MLSSLNSSPSLPLRSGAVCTGCVAFALMMLMTSGDLCGQNGPTASQQQAAAQVPSPSPSAPVAQPLPFSHKLHTQFLQQCQDCHQISSDGWTMSYPPVYKCMTCHATIKTDSPAIKKLAEFAAQKKPVPWVQIYRVPDYVYFSHRTHVQKAKLDCENCHGPVRERDVLTKEKPTSMAACIRCHQEKGAPTGCRTCHDSI